MSDEKIEEKITEETVAEASEPSDQEDSERLSDLVVTIKQQYEQQIASLNAKHAKDVAERDKLIAQLLDENKQPQTETIADRINGKRKYKKW